MTGGDAILVLAAGSSRRLGSPKQLVTFEGQTLVERAVDAALASGATYVHVVLGAKASAIEAALGARPVVRVLNDLHEAGLSSSIRAGLDSALRADPALTSVLVMLCDQPHVDAAHLARLRLALVDGRALIAASQYEDVVGVPAAFARSVFGELATLEGDRGARHVIRADATRVVGIPFARAAFDVDRACDVEALAGASSID